MSDLVVRLHYRTPDGRIEDAKADYELTLFAGVLPNIGDQILDPGVPAGQNRHDPKNRELLTVVGRVFNPRDHESYVALICESRGLQEDEYALAP